MKNFEVSLLFEDDPDYYKQNYEMDLKMAAAFSYYNNLPMDIRSACGSDELMSSVEKKNFMVSSSVKTIILPYITSRRFNFIIENISIIIAIKGLFWDKHNR
jgi:hypothetical protein